MRLGLN